MNEGAMTPASEEAGESKKKEPKSWRVNYNVGDDESHNINVEQLENGYMVEHSHHNYKANKHDTRKFYSESNPLGDVNLKDDKTEKSLKDLKDVFPMNPFGFGS